MPGIAAELDQPRVARGLEHLVELWVLRVLALEDVREEGRERLLAALRLVVPAHREPQLLGAVRVRRELRDDADHRRSLALVGAAPEARLLGRVRLLVELCKRVERCEVAAHLKTVAIALGELARLVRVLGRGVLLALKRDARGGKVA